MLLFCKFFGKNKSKKDQFTLISLPVLLISSENLLVYLPEAFILSISTKLEKASWTFFFASYGISMINGAQLAVG